MKLIAEAGWCKTFLAVDESQVPQIPCVVQQFAIKHQNSEAFTQKIYWRELLDKHPQIPLLLAYFQDDDYLYFVEELIFGSNFSTLLREEGIFSETQIWQFLENVLPVIKFIHDHQIIHRDIQPKNLIYTPACKKLFLVNFNAAILNHEIHHLTEETIIGSPEYIAPEQARGKAVFASDLYSLGVTCIHLLTQIPPFDLFDIANDAWVWQDYCRHQVSDRLTKILDKLLQHALNRRFQSADEVMQAMGITDNSPPQPFPAPPAQPKWECIDTFSSHAGFATGINSLAFNPDGDILASGDEDKIVRLWDLNSKKVLASLAGHSQAVKSVAFSPDGQILATASDDKTIKLWNVKTYQQIFTLTGHSRAVKSVAFSPDGQILASGSWDKTVKIWDVRTGEEICHLTGHKLQVSSVAFSSDGRLLASASLDRTIRLWQLPPGELKNHPDCTLLATLAGHSWAVLTVAFSLDGKILATGSDDNTVKLWKVDTGEVLTTLSGHSWAVVAVAFAADGETLISGSWDQTVKLWQLSTATEIATFSGHEDSVFTVAVNPVARLIASGSRDKSIKLWQLV
ncbi:serine/threonine-protein kinase [Fortiea contorta]|uniref:serine/threonine-protein kinase n=1 Tax=Fortiea contorta TaxID=1892405 RepID=UPI000345A367|nr:serine/threonine-protein kinase [Fortiea contorta]